jgi:hypothetical protein
MTGFLFAFIAVLLAGIGARDQITVARLASAMGQRPSLLAVAIALSLATAAFAAWLSTEVTPWLNPQARLLFAAIALGFAGVESLLLSPGRRPEEPTQSLAAISIVLLAHQLTDAARFPIFGLAVATGAAIPAGAGGALGGAFLLVAAWAVPELFDWSRLRLWRRITGALLLAAALIAGSLSLG